jgi:hypothetical protein
MLVVSDTDDVFLPKPTDLLVNLVECRSSLETLLGRINDMFQDNLTVGSAMGPALQAGFKLMVGFYCGLNGMSNITSRFPLVVKSWSSLHHCRTLVLVL